MESFYRKFPNIAEEETRCIVIMNKEEGLPNGEYFLVESYCNDPKCDCRRVFINVISKEKIFATIGYGWENIEFYEQWIGEQKWAKNAKGPILELTGEHTEYSEKLLELFENIILADKVFVDRLNKHYKMFKESLNPQSNKDEAILKNFNPNLYTVIDLCKEKDIDIDSINDDNKERFYPILMNIEETIFNYYIEDNSLKDSDVMELLKNLRNNIFSENAKFNDLEQHIIINLKIILFYNNFSRKEVILSISRILGSVKLHRSLGESRGYLKFISKLFFNEREDDD